jgi:hypothetical protein
LGNLRKIGKLSRLYQKFDTGALNLTMVETVAVESVKSLFPKEWALP